jgi:acyl dehydratase
VSARPDPDFDALVVGREWRSPGRTVTETDIVLFAGLSGDYNVLHTDAEYMKSSRFGERIAHGLLGLSVQHGLLGRALPECFGERLVSYRWKFRAPIRIGDTVHVTARIGAKRPADTPGWGVVVLERSLVNQNGEVVQEGETEHLVERRPAGGAG